MKSIFVEMDREELSSIVCQAVRHELTNAGLNSAFSSPKEDNDIMTAEEVCELLDMKISGLYQKTHARLIPFMKKGKKLYFSRQEINTWLKSGGVITTEQERLQDDQIFYQKHQNRPKKINR
jgi:excisionase family DNA binding protein